MNILHQNKQNEFAYEANSLISYIFDFDRSLKGQFVNHQYKRSTCYEP